MTYLILIQNKDSYYNIKKESNPYTKDKIYIYILLLIISIISITTFTILLKKELTKY